jgi:hypothetical protein
MSVRPEDRGQASDGPESAETRAVQQSVFGFLQTEVGFAQLCTVNRDGFPVARTMGAHVNDDWSVDLIQRQGHRRLDQLRHNPRVEIIWVGTPTPDSTNDHPHVFDFGLLVPRVVFLRGVADFMDAEWTVQRFTQLAEIQRAQGHIKAPERTAENIRAELVGVRICPVQIRAEGFGVGARSYTWTTEGSS